MRASILSLIGVALIGIGGYVLYAGGYVTTRRQVLKVGTVQISAEERHPIEPWMAGAALVAGTALVIVGLTRKV